jgi:hypothetical protein
MAGRKFTTIYHYLEFTPNSKDNHQYNKGLLGNHEKNRIVIAWKL